MSEEMIALRVRLEKMRFPEDHRPKIHSTNPPERLNGEIERRTVAGIFPNKAALAVLQKSAADPGADGLGICLVFWFVLLVRSGLGAHTRAPGRRSEADHRIRAGGDARARPPRLS